MSDPVRFGPKFPLPIAPISRGSMVFNKTGTWRYLKPKYENKVAPCRNGCPSAMPIERVMALVEKGDYSSACQEILKENPFPSICGRVCYHPCETACNRKEFDSPITIQLIERFVADHTCQLSLHPDPEPKTERSVAVVGGGPSGISAAYFLALLGHRVTIFEAEKELGGILRYGIPPYRLPRPVLDREIQGILALDIQIEAGVRVGKDIPWSELNKFDARFLGPGLGKSRDLGIPGENAENVEKGLDFLRRFNGKGPKHLGRRIIVIGGGNTAIDVVRTAKRAGCKDINLLYRRTRREMPALPSEVAEAERENITLHFLELPTQLITDDSKRVVAMEVIHMELSEPDASGRARPIPIANSEHIMETDHVIIAIGETEHETAMPANAKLERHQKLPLVTDLKGITYYAGGDLSNDSLTVVAAIASGKRAAIAIDSRFRRKDLNFEELNVARGGVSFARYRGEREVHRNETVGIDRINKDYFCIRNRARTPRLSLAERISSFKEVNFGLSEETARAEASECFHCGVCTSCDNCYSFCPDIAVIKNSDRTYRIQEEYCKGCGICVAECPRGAMEMDIEESEIK